MADGSVPIVLSPEPFARTTTYVEAPAGCTVRTMLASAITHGHLQLDDLPRTNVYVDGVRLDREEALSLILAEGQIVNVVVEPLGGGGGKKEIGQILLTIAVIAVSMWIGGPTGPLKAWPMLARQVAAAAILTAGQMAVAAIFKPETNASKINEKYALSSASNQYRPWGSMPLALGEVVVAPDLAVKTFTQAQGEDQWIYGILGLHYGPCTAEDLKIGDTLVSSMGAGDVRVAYHLTPGPRTFSIVANDTDQLDLQEELAATVSGSTAVVRAASAEGERFEFDFFMPQGLYFAKDDGRKIAASLTVTIRYRPIDQNGVPTGSGAWANGLTIALSSASSDPWRIMRELTLPLGRYEFEVKRSKLEDDNAKRKTDIGWTAIRAIAFRKPVVDETLSLIEFAVRASALNQGNLAPFTCRITPVCETWTGSAWGTPAPTSNPAAITRWLMTGPAPAIPLTKPQADVGLRTWAALCEQYNWKTHIYLTEDRKQDAVMQLLGMNGRASLFWDGTQLVSSPWVEKPAPRQLFAGSNLKDHRWEIVYPDPVHALRVEFQNIDQGGEADEIYVYADGYGETADPANNILPATLVEALRLEGQQTIERAYRDGRWNLGARLHQRRVDSWSTDIEHIVCRYGDRVRLAWDRVGTANATVRNRLWSGGLVSGLRLSQPVRMEPGRSYALDLRLPDQVITGVPVVNPATTSDVVTRSIIFADLRSANVSPRGGDLVAFGEPERVSEDVEIIGITPGTDLTANMVGIRYVAPLLMAGETGPIPPLQSRLTRDRAMDPPTPTLLGWQANEEGVRIGFSMPPWRGSPITGFSVRWRQTPEPGQSSAWVPLPDLPANAMTAVTPPLRELPAEGTNVTSAQVQIVAVTADGRASTPPLQITVQEAAIQQPPSGDWTVTELTEAPDGSRQSGFLVIGLVGSINPRRVTVEYGASVNGLWDAAFDGAPVQGVVRAPILGMSPGAQCWIAITYWTAQAAAPSVRRVLGPYTAPSLVAGDLSPESPVWTEIELQGVAIGQVTGRLQTVEDIADANARAVADLETVYGDTASAAASAAQAAQAKADAILAKADAVQAKTDAVAAAGASASSASQAGGFKTAAETASAAAASSQVSASTNATAATSAAVAVIPDTISAALWSPTTTPGAPDSRASLATSQVLNGAYRSGVGTTGAAGPKQYVRWETGRVYELTFIVSANGGSAANARVVIGRRDASFAALSSSFGPSTMIAAGAEVTVTRRFGMGVTPSGGTNIVQNSAEWIAFGVQGNIKDGLVGAEPGADQLFKAFKIRDVTSLVASENSASASATSAANASASETAAGLSATASQNARTGAETARGQAQAFRDETATSRDTAVGAAATASSQAQLATTAKDAAAGSASAAAGSASTAESKAGEAGTSAAAALASQVSASTAAAGAQSVANRLIPDRVAVAADFAPQVANAPENAGTITTGTVVAVAGVGDVRQQAGAIGVYYTKGVIAIAPGGTYRVRARTRITVNGGSPVAQVHIYCLDSAYASVGAVGTNSPILSSASDWTDTEVVRTYDQLKAISANTAYIRGRLVVNGNAGNVYQGSTAQTDRLSLADITSETKAAGSASASATSAVNASASETAAGQSATAASGSATTASTKAGEASTFAGQASTSAANAAGSATTASTASGVAVTARDQASTARDQAQASAASAVTQAGNATASASSASLSANLAAQAGFGSSNKNPTFADWPASQTLPAQINAFGSVTTQRDIGKVSPNAVRVEVASGVTNAGIEIAWTASNWNGRLPTANGQTSYWVIEYKIEVGTPNLGSSALRFLLTNGATGASASDVVVKRLSEIHASTGDDQIVEGRFFLPCSPNVAAPYYSARMAFFARTDANANYSRYLVHKLLVRPADATEIAGQIGLPAVQAQLNITAGVATDAQTRLANVIFEVIGASGGDPFQLLFKTVGSSSLGQMVASALRFGNVIGGQVVDVMKLVGGSVFITGKLLLGAAGQIELDPAYPLILWKFGSARLAIGQIPNDQLFFWFGPSVEVSQMRRNNATVYMDRNGRGHWMGAITAGTISNSIQGSNVNVPVSAALGPFSTNGGPIVVNWSYSFDRTGRRWGNQTGGVSGTTSALVRLYQKIGNGSETLVDTMTVNGDLAATYDGEAVPGQPGGTVGQTFISEYMGASKTYTDNVGGTAARTYRVEVASRSNKSVSGQSPAADSMDQRYGATSSE